MLRSAARTWGKFLIVFGVAGIDLQGSLAIISGSFGGLLGGTCPGRVWTQLSIISADSSTVDGDSGRLGLSSMLINVARNLGKQLMTDALPKTTAPLFKVAMVISAEVLVMDLGSLLVARVLAFLPIVMAWGALRSDDVVWLDRSRLLLSEIGLLGVLLRTKTSAAGRRVPELPVFVIRTASRDMIGSGKKLTCTFLALEIFQGYRACVPKTDFTAYSEVPGGIDPDWMDALVGASVESARLGDWR